jgi:hypothetical protein
MDDDSHEALSPELLGSYNEWRRHITSRLEAAPDAFSSAPLTLLLGRKRLQFDVNAKAIKLHDGSIVHYDSCLVASAGKVPPIAFVSEV